MGLAFHDFPEWPETLDRETALAFSGLSESTMRDLEQQGAVKFLPLGPNGRNVTRTEDLRRAIAGMWNADGPRLPSENMEF